MSTISYTAARFDRTWMQQHRTGGFRQESVRTSWLVPAAVWAFWIGLCDGIAAYRQYEHLRSQGVTHEAALKTALPRQPLDLAKNKPVNNEIVVSVESQPRQVRVLSV
jgi:hypothetical protein